MNLLAFDTSTDVMSIAVQRGEVGAIAGSIAGSMAGSMAGSIAGAVGGMPEVWQHTGTGGAQASTTLIPAIQQLMQQANLRFDQLDAIAFGRGPGSFTGLRTACSVAQGLAFGAGVPVLPVDTLLALAEEARHQWIASANAPRAADAQAPFRVLAVLDARMDEVYAAEYEFNSVINVINVNSAMPLLQKNHGLVKPENLVLQAGWLLAGNAVQAYGDRMPGSAAERIAALPTAQAMLRLAPALLAAGHAVAADQALPTYIRDKVAKTTQERAQDKIQKTAA